MNVPPNVPGPKRELLGKLVESLAHITGIEAVVLGGSYASGTQHAASDLDIGLYYHEAEPFSIDEIRRVAMEISRPSATPTVTDFYEWGVWVNGGAWIETPAGKLDFLYRNLEQVRKTIAEAQEGIIRHDYDQQPTHGYYSVGYLAETQICIPLHDPSGEIAALKESVKVYPPKLKQRIINSALWSAEFTLKHAQGFAEKGDVYNTTGCLVRAAANLTQVLFALNEEYFLTDKKVLETLSAFEIGPAGYAEKVTSILAGPGRGRVNLTRSVAEMGRALNSVVELTQGR